MITKTRTAILLGSMIVLLATVTTLQTTGSSAQAETLDGDDTGPSLLEALSVGLPVWDASINQTPFDVQEVSFMENPWDVATLVSDSAFTFKELQSSVSEVTSNLG